MTSTRLWPINPPQRQGAAARCVTPAACVVHAQCCSALIVFYELSEYNWPCIQLTSALNGTSHVSKNRASVRLGFGLMLSTISSISWSSVWPTTRPDACTVKGGGLGNLHSAMCYAVHAKTCLRVNGERPVHCHQHAPRRGGRGHVDCHHVNYPFIRVQQDVPAQRGVADTKMLAAQQHGARLQVVACGPNKVLPAQRAHVACNRMRMSVQDVARGLNTATRTCNFH